MHDARTRRRCGSSSRGRSSSCPATISPPTQVGGDTRRTWSTFSRVSRSPASREGTGSTSLIAPLAVGGAWSRSSSDSDARAGAPTTTLWFCDAGDRGCSCSPLLARRRFPFAAPATYWLLGGGDLVRGRAADRVPDQPLRRRDGGRVAARATCATSCRRLGPGVVSPARRSSSTTIPGHSPAQLVFIPLLFAIGWLAGFALRERAEQAEAAEERAAGPSASARRRRGSRWPRSARGSRASCTTSSPTRSA